MLPSLDRTIDVTTGLYFGLMSISGLMLHRNQCGTQTSNNGCPISLCSQANLKLALLSGTVASGMYLYRGLRR